MALQALLMMSLMISPSVAQTPASPGIEPLPTQFIVKWKSPMQGTDPSEMVTRMRRAANRARYSGVSISALRNCPYAQQSVVRLSGFNTSMTRADLSELLQTVAQQSDIEYIQEDRIMHHMVVPNDPSYSKQWHYGGVQSGGVYKSGLTYGINLPGAWDIVKGSPQIVVADVDTGITSHPDLDGLVVPGYDMVSDVTTANDKDGRDADPSDPCDASQSEPTCSWHGTHVIGTIGAQTNNGVGVASAGWGVKLQAVRALGVGGGTESDINDGIRWAAGVPVSGAPANKNPSKVINLSLGGSGSCGQADQEAIDAAIGAGAIVVIAAGNSNENTKTASPCNCKNVICVGSHGPSGQRAAYSNYGAEVALMAPGGDSQSGSQSYMVYSTYNTGTKSPGSPSYGYMEGTSMATPHVAGLVALMASIDPALVQEEAKSILQLTARPFPASTSTSKCDKTTCGAGLADATAAIQFMQNRPANDRCAAATPLACGALVQGSTQYATSLSKDTACGSTSTTSADVWYSLTLSATTSVRLSTCQNGTTFNTQMAVYSGSCDKLTCMAGQDDSPGCGTQTVMSVSLPAGTSLIRVSGKGTDRGTFSLAVTCDGVAPPPTASPAPQQPPVTLPDPSPEAASSPEAPPAVSQRPRFSHRPRLPSPLPSPEAVLPDPSPNNAPNPVCQATPATCNSGVTGSTSTASAEFFFWPGRPRPGWPRWPGPFLPGQPFPGGPFIPGRPFPPMQPGQPYPPVIPGQPYPPTVPGQPYPPTVPGQPGQPYPGQPGQPGQPYPGQPGQPGQPYPGQPGQGCQDVSLSTPATWYSLSLANPSTVIVRSAGVISQGMQLAAFSSDCSNPTCLTSTGPAQQGTTWQQLYIQAQGQVWLAVFSPGGSAATSYQLQISCA